MSGRSPPRVRGDDATSIHDSSSTSSRLAGLMWLSAWQECPQAAITGIAVGYGR